MKPMLAGKAPEFLDDIKFPVLATPKIDGIRCLTFEYGEPKSRSLKPIPNESIQRKLEELGIEGLDGELMIPDAATFGEVSGPIMRRTGAPKFVYCVFDLWDRTQGYADRVESLKAVLADAPDWVQILEPMLIKNADELVCFEEACLAQGHEGVMLRQPDSPYKQGRSSTKQGWLLKLKRFDDDEAEIIGFVEEQHNANEATKDALGHTQRSTHKEGKVAKGSLGALRVRAINGKFAGAEFKIGTGFTADQRRMYWIGRDRLLGLTVKFRHQPHGGKDSPRIPSFLGFRSDEDMS